MSVGSYGCSFRCGGCHNLEISWGVTALDDLARGQSTAAYVTPDDLVAAALRHEVQGIAFTYSEPAVWLEYVLNVSVAARAAGLYSRVRLEQLRDGRGAGADGTPCRRVVLRHQEPG